METIHYLSMPGLKERPKLMNTSKEFPEVVSRIAAEEMGINWNELFTDNRKQKVSFCRSISFYLIRRHSKVFTLQAISDYFGGRHHSTVIHGVQVVQNMMKTNEEFSRMVNRIEGLI